MGSGAAGCQERQANPGIGLRNKTDLASAATPHEWSYYSSLYAPICGCVVIFDVEDRALFGRRFWFPGVPSSYGCITSVKVRVLSHTEVLRSLIQRGPGVLVIATELPVRGLVMTSASIRRFPLGPMRNHPVTRTCPFSDTIPAT